MTHFKCCKCVSVIPISYTLQDKHATSLIGVDVSIFNPQSDSPSLGDFRFNESDVDNSISVYVRLDNRDGETVTLQRNVDILLSTSQGTAGLCSHAVHTHPVELFVNTDNTDFVGVYNGLLTIPSGSDYASFNITIRGDIVPESDEEFTFNISTVNPADQVVSPSQGTITILNDDEGKKKKVHEVCM